MLYDLPEYIGNMKFENEKKNTREILYIILFLNFGAFILFGFF